MELRLDGRLALVTGAGSGIGAASAAALAEAGAAVAVTDIDLDAARRVAASLGDSGLRALPVGLDVSLDEDWAGLSARSPRSSARSPSCTAAALTSPVAYAADLGVIDLDMVEYDRVMAVNLRGAVLGC